MKTKATAMRLTTALFSFALTQVSFGPEVWAQLVPQVGAITAPVGGASAAAGSVNAGNTAAIAAPLAAPLTASPLAAPTAPASDAAEASAPALLTPEMSDAVTRNNPLKDLHRFGVSVWYDNVSRALIASGELKRLIDEDGVRGLTSNPTIFEKAISGSVDYDGSIRRHARPGQTPVELFEFLAVEDIQAASDVLRPLYDESKGADGFVSLEVAPGLAKNAEGTVAEAKRLWALVARPNLMVKVPGTAEGVRAFEDLTAEGISVNVTLLFAQGRYAEVAEAYVKGLERRAAAGKDLSRIASVASFFVSRVDAAIDAVLEKRPEPEAKALLGKAAIANAKLAYQHYKKLFGSARFATLAAKGAKTQRLLWASTGTKNPLYRDVLYVEELIGSDTVNTMPPATVDAYRDHGAGRFSLEERLDDARAQWAALPRYGVDISVVMAKLMEDGLKSFAQSFDTLMDRLAARSGAIHVESKRRLTARP